MHTGQSTFSHASRSKNCYVVLSVLEERDLSDMRNLQECSRTIAIPSSRQPYIPLVASSRRHFTTGYLPSFASLQDVCGSSTATSPRRALQLGNLKESPTTSLTFSLCSFFLCSPLLLLLSQACLCLARTLSAAKHCQGEPASSFLFLFLFPRSWLLLSLGGNSPLRTYSRRAASDTETSLCARASNEGAVTVCGKLELDAPNERRRANRSCATWMVGRRGTLGGPMAFACGRLWACVCRGGGCVQLREELVRQLQ